MWLWSLSCWSHVSSFTWAIDSCAESHQLPVPKRISRNASSQQRHLIPDPTFLEILMYTVQAPVIVIIIKVWNNLKICPTVRRCFYRYQTYRSLIHHHRYVYHCSMMNPSEGSPVTIINHDDESITSSPPPPYVLNKKISVVYDQRFIRSFCVYLCG